VSSRAVAATLLDGLTFGRVGLADDGPGPAAWERKAELPALRPGEVHLWLADLDAAPDELQGWLSREERAKAASFHEVRDGRRSGIARAILRGLLGAYLGLPPGVVPLGRDAGGKPRLLGGQQPMPRGPVSRRDSAAFAPGVAPEPLAGATGPLEFNLSHSSGRALFAFARGTPLGVDLEGPEAAPPEPQLLAAAYFHPDEVARLGAGPGATQRFLDLWTRKEAFGKARGDGLAAAVSPGPRIDLGQARQRLAGGWLCVGLELPCPGAGALVVAC